MRELTPQQEFKVLQTLKGQPLKKVRNTLDLIVKFKEMKVKA